MAGKEITSTFLQCKLEAFKQMSLNDVLTNPKPCS